MTFEVDGDVTLIENRKLVSVIKELLSTGEENVEKALLYRTVSTGRDVIEKQHTAQEASYGRDALAKVLLSSQRGSDALGPSEVDRTVHISRNVCGAGKKKSVILIIIY